MKKTTKVELVSALALLIVAAVMMTSASFAWYTISQNADMSGVKVHMTATRNVEIAMVSGAGTTIPNEVSTADTKNQFAWGGTISLTNKTAEVALPATANSIGICTLQYDTTGRTSGFAIGQLTSEADSDGMRYYTANIVNAYNNTSMDAVKANVTIAAVFDVWVRTNTPENYTTSTTKASMYVSYGSVTVSSDAAGENILNNVSGKVSVFVGTEDNTTYVDIDESTDLVSPKASKTPFDVEINKPTKVRIVVYIDGDTILAKNAWQGAYITGLNVGFYNTVMDPIN